MDNKQKLEKIQEQKQLVLHLEQLWLRSFTDDNMNAWKCKQVYDEAKNTLNKMITEFLSEGDGANG